MVPGSSTTFLLGFVFLVLLPLFYLKSALLPPFFRNAKLEGVVGTVIFLLVALVGFVLNVPVENFWVEVTLLCF
jgi:hypothetical protein